MRLRTPETSLGCHPGRGDDAAGAAGADACDASGRIGLRLDLKCDQPLTGPRQGVRVGGALRRTPRASVSPGLADVTREAPVAQPGQHGR